MLLPQCLALMREAATQQLAASLLRAILTQSREARQYVCNADLADRLRALASLPQRTGDCEVRGLLPGCPVLPPAGGCGRAAGRQVQL